MIVVFSSSLRDFEQQNMLIHQALVESGKRFIVINPLSYEDLQKIKLQTLKGKSTLMHEGNDVTPTTIFISRLWRSDCVIDVPENCIYPTILRQKINYFLEEIYFCFKDVNIFPGKLESIQFGDSKSALYGLASQYELVVPELTINSFTLPENGPAYRKVLGFPFSISLNNQENQEVAVTLLNEWENGSELLGIPWQWQTGIRPTKHIRCVVVGDKIWAYSLSESQLSGRSLREAHEDGDLLNWEKDTLPPQVTSKLRSLLGGIGLRYSAPEFIVDEYGEYFFIDLNPCGDWYGFSNDDEGLEIAREIVKKL